MEGSNPPFILNNIDVNQIKDAILSFGSLFRPL